MPHINIKYYSTLTKEQQSEMALALTKVITNILQCEEGAVSIALEPIEKELWYQNVYVPEIIKRKELLFKIPNY